MNFVFDHIDNYRENYKRVIEREKKREIFIREKSARRIVNVLHVRTTRSFNGDAAGRTG